VVNPLTFIIDIVDRFITYILWPIFICAVLIMMIYAGFMFVTSRGDPSKVKAARDAVIWTVIGIVVVIFAFSAYNFVRSIVAPGAS